MYRYRTKSIRVIDGDTVEAEIDLGFHVSVTQKLRLFGINTPELRGEEKPAGIAAKTHLEVLIARNEPIIVQTQKDKTGKYGRYLATLFSEKGLNLNTQMVQDGHAAFVSYGEEL